MYSFRRSKLTMVLSVLLIVVVGFTLLNSTGSIARATAPILKRAMVPGGPTVDPCNANVAIQVGMTPGSDFGRFNEGAYPDPSTCGTGPNSFNLSYAWPNPPSTSFTTMRIDGQDFVYGTDGSSIQTPTDVGGTTNVSQWQLTSNIQATQTLEITTGPTTGKLDTALIEYDITNTDTVSHSVGVRAMIDTMLNNNDGAPFFIPGAGAVTTESDFTGAAVPQRWQAFYSLTSSPQFSAEGTLIGLPAVTPDRFVIASWPSIYQTKFDYTTTPGLDVTGDSAVAAYWMPKALAPGSTLHVATLYGLSGFTSDLTPPLALSLTAPSSLTVDSHGNLTPNPFTISGFIEDVGSATATGATATLTLPSGLALAAGETATHALGDLSPNQTTFTSWQVMASTAGTLTFSVTATNTNTPPTPKTVSRSIIVPVAQSPGPSPSSSSTTGGGFPNMNPTTCSCAKPVNTATGEFWHHFDDLTVPGRGIALDLSRTYSASHAAQDGPLGYGWTDDYQMALTTDQTTGDITVHANNGSMVTFTANGSGYQPPSYVLTTLIKNGDGTFTYKTNDQSTFVFSTTGQLLKEVDRNGYATTLTYTGTQLSTVTDPAGRALTFTYGSSGRIATVTDPAGRKVSFTYDASGNLITATEVNGGVWHFTYDANHQMLTMTDPRGGVLTNIYDSSGRVTSQTDPLGRKTTFTYVTDTSGGEATTMTDATGNQTLYQYQNLELIAVTKGYGTPQAATTTYTYDAATLGVTSVTDPNGHTTTMTYDAVGNLLTTTDALGHTTTNTYDNLNDLLTTTDALGVTTTMTYDAAGNLLSSSRPLSGTSQSQVTAYKYTDTSHPGDLTAVIDADGKTWTFGYDTYGNLTKSTDPLGDVTTSLYNTIGWKLSQVSPKGNVKGAKPSQYRTSFGYDVFGQVTTTTDPLGHKTTNTYDVDSNLISTTDADGKVTKYSYDAANELITVMRADGTTVQTTYTADGNVYQQIDGKGKVTTYGYDALDREISVMDPLGRSTTFTYDGAGNQLTMTDPQGQVTTYGYDAGNELTSITYSDGKTPNVSSIQYDAVGQRIAMNDGVSTSTWTWDSLHRLTQSNDGLGDIVVYGYDLKGQLTSILYPGQSTPVTRTYDGAGRLHTVTDWMGNTTTFNPDADSNPGTIVFPSGTKVTDTYTFDRADRLMGITDTKSGTPLASFIYTRDNNGQLTSEKNKGVPGVPDTYAYNALNELTTANGKSYAYNAADNLTALTSGATLAYDDANEVCWTLPSASSNACSSPPVGVTTYGYDKRGNRISVTPPSGGSTTLTYDQANRLIAYGSSTTYVYNGDGLRVKKVVSGTTYGMVWNVAQGLSLLMEDGTAAYIYGDGGQLLERISGNTVSYYHTDQLGSVRVMTDSSGKVLNTYSYDPYGNVTGSTGTAPNAFKFAGEYQDSESGLYYFRARYFDPTTAQFLTRDPAVAKTRSPYAYVAGNPLNSTDPSGKCGLWGNDSCLGDAGGWVAHHPLQTVGIALGAVSLATGVGEVVGATVVIGDLTIGATALGTASFVTGTAGTLLDSKDCLGGDAASCVGTALGLPGAVAGVADLLPAGLLSKGLLDGLDYTGLGTGAFGFGWDIAHTLSGC